MTERAQWQRARQPEQKEERRAAILAATARLLDSEGLEGTGINAIAREVGLSKPNLYRYFESREAILLDLLLEEYQHWAVEFGSALKSLQGSDDEVKVASSLADTLEDKARFCLLLSAVATVLEHNVGPETIATFKFNLISETRPVAEELVEALSFLDLEGADQFLAILLMSASGMWSHCHPAPAVREVLQRPEMEPLRFDFRVLIQSHATLLLTGLRASLG